MFAQRKEHIGHAIVSEFHWGNNTNAIAKSIKGSYGNGVEHERTCTRWFSHFRKGDFSLKDETRKGYPRRLDSKGLEVDV